MGDFSQLKINYEWFLGTSSAVNASYKIGESSETTDSISNISFTVPSKILDGTYMDANMASDMDYIWLQLTINAQGYDTLTKTFKFERYGKIEVSFNEIWTAHTNDKLKVGDTLSITSDELPTKSYSVDTIHKGISGQSYYGTSLPADDTTPSVDVSYTYKWFASESSTTPTIEEALAQTNLADTDTANAFNIPATTKGKFIYCLVSASISEDDAHIYKLNTTNFIKSFAYNAEGTATKVEGASVIITFAAYTFENTTYEGINIHDEITGKITKIALDSDPDVDIKDSVIANTDLSVSWSSSIGDVLSGYSSAISEDWTFTYKVEDAKNLVGATVTPTVVISKEGYETSQAGAATSIIVKAPVAISAPVLTSNLVYNDGRQIISVPAQATDILTGDSNDLRGAVYYSTTQDGCTAAAGVKDLSELLNVNINAYNGEEQIQHAIYYAYIESNLPAAEGDANADHDDTQVGSVTFTIDKATVKKITINAPESAIVYGENDTVTYEIEYSDGSKVTTGGTVSSSNTNIVTVDGSSLTAQNGTGTADISVSVPASDNYVAASSAPGETKSVSVAKRTLNISAEDTISTVTPTFGNEVNLNEADIDNNAINGDEVTYTYQWYTKDGDTLEVIPDATDATYTPNAEQAASGKQITCKVTVTPADTNKYDVQTTNVEKLIVFENVVAKRTLDASVAFTGSSIYGQIVNAEVTVTDAA